MPSDIVAGTESRNRKKKGKHGNSGRGGPTNEIGEYRWDPECRYEKHWDTGIHQGDCKSLFGNEFTWDKNVREQMDPYGHADWTDGHYHCPAFAFHHKCIRDRHLGSAKECCLNDQHGRGGLTCEPKYRGYKSFTSNRQCYPYVYDHCKSDSKDPKVLMSVLTDEKCSTFLSDPLNPIPATTFDVMGKLCNTNDPKTLVERLKNSACKDYYWDAFSVSKTVKGRTGEDVTLPKKEDLIKVERDKFCFDKNKDGVYHNILKDLDWAEENGIEDLDLQKAVNCRDICIRDSKINDTSLQSKCNSAWKQTCEKKGFDKFGSSNRDYKDYCPTYWDNDKVRLTKIGQMIKETKDQKPDACAFAALTQVENREMETQDPVCWYNPQRNSKIAHNLHNFTGLVKNERKCQSNSYSICCQKIQLEGEISAPNIEIEQSCPKAKLENPNTVTDMEDYEVPVPWLAPPFKPDPKCKEVPRPTGIICEDPEDYPDFSDFMKDQVKFNADEIKEIVTSNWEKKVARDKAEEEALIASIEAASVEDPETVAPVLKKVEKKKSFIEMILEFFRKLFGGGKKKSKEERKKEAEEDEALLEEFTDIPNKNTIIAIFVLLVLLYLIYKVFSNKSVQQGIGLGVGMNIGDNIGETLVNNSSTIKRVGSSAINTISDAGSEAFDTFKSSGALDTIQDVGSGLLNKIGEVGSDVVQDILQ